MLYASLKILVFFYALELSGYNVKKNLRSSKEKLLSQLQSSNKTIELARLNNTSTYVLYKSIKIMCGI